MFDLLDLLGSSSSARPSDEVTLLRATREAMATQFEVVLPAAIPDATELASQALDQVEALEAQLTIYREDSEVSLLNRDAPRRAVAVEPGLFQLLETAARLTRETDGAFDVTVGQLLKVWGFTRRAGRVPTPRERQEAMQQAGMRHVILDAASRSVRYLRDGLEINLGAIGKGYALDRVALSLQAAGVRSGLLHGGSSSVRAWGRPHATVAGWSVAILHPWQRERTLGVVRLQDAALGTSAATFQFFEYNGRTLGHILDPRTGWPAETLAQASVVAVTAAEADALSTALYVLGLGAAREYCRTHPEIGAILLSSEPGATPEIHNLPPGQFTPQPTTSEPE